MSGYFVYDCSLWVLIFFFKQKTAYEMRISDWSSDVCSSDLSPALPSVAAGYRAGPAGEFRLGGTDRWQDADRGWPGADVSVLFLRDAYHSRSEEHTSELQSLMRISYAVFCLKKKKTRK